MTEGDYLDFDLLIEQHDGQYRARVLASPSGEAETTFALPFSLDRIELKALQLLPMRGTRRASPQLRKQAQEFGAMLFDSMFVKDIRMCFRDSQRAAKAADKGLRIRLRLGDAALEVVPWEFLYSDMQDDFLVLSRHTPIVRYIELSSTIPPEPIRLPLKILVMISNPIDHQQLDTEQEWLRLNAALADRIERGEIELTLVPRGTLSSLRETLQEGDFHIFHYIGHAAFDEAHDDGVLVLEGPDRKASIVAGRDLSTILADQKTLRLALLNACEGARTSDEDRFNGIAQSLIRRGLPAAIAMQFEISDDAAKDLSHDFYGALSSGLPVDMALAEARRGVFSKGNVIEWATPVLYLRSGSGNIFDIDDAAPLHIDDKRDEPAPVIEPTGGDVNEVVDLTTPTIAPQQPVPVAPQPFAATATESSAVPAPVAKPSPPPPAPTRPAPTPAAPAPPRSAPAPAEAPSGRPWWQHPAAIIVGVLVGLFVIFAIIGAALESGQATASVLRERLTAANVSVVNFSDAELEGLAQAECNLADGSDPQTWIFQTSHYDQTMRTFSNIALQTYCSQTWSIVSG